MGERTDEMNRGELGEDSPSPERIRQEIRETQRDMSHTIDEIQYRLSPQHLMEQTKQSVRRAGVNTSRNFIDRVKEHPLPAAMVGVGLWLMFRNSDDQANGYDRFVRSGRDYSSGYEPYTRPTVAGDYPAGYGYPGGFDRGADEGGRFEAVREKAEDLKERTGELVSSARERTSGALHDAGERAQQQMRRVRYQSRDLLRESPLAVGLAAIAAGAILGGLIPETEKENELMGETRDRLARQAKEAAHEGIDKARNVATAVGQAAKEAAQDAAKAEGLTGGGKTAATSPSRAGATDIGTSITPGVDPNLPSSGNR